MCARARRRLPNPRNIQVLGIAKQRVEDAIATGGTHELCAAMPMRKCSVECCRHDGPGWPSVGVEDEPWW